MTERAAIGRRRALLAIGSGVGGPTVLAGCTDGPTFPDADVIAGPETRLIFEPAALSVPVGATVTWGFASGGHNVSGRPADADRVRLPDGADPFASYDPDEPPLTVVPRGETYRHTFGTPGEYRYVCVPHVPSDMVGTVTVE